MISLHARKHVSCEYCMETISHATRDVCVCVCVCVCMCVSVSVQGRRKVSKKKGGGLLLRLILKLSVYFLSLLCHF